MNRRKFNDDECQYLNKIFERKTNVQLSRNDVVSYVLFARDIADSDNEQIIELIDGLYSKLNLISEEEWDILKNEIPFPVNINAEDNVDEVLAE